MGDLPRIELFARQRTRGWNCAGNEVDGMDIQKKLSTVILQKT